MSGRPTKYKPEYAEIARKVCELGATDKEVADILEVTEQTLNNWKKDFPEFFESLKLGKKAADDRVERSLYHRAVGYSHPEEKIFNNQGEIVRAETVKHYPPDSTAMIFWLKNRKQDEWRDRRELTGADGEPLLPQNDVELAKRMALILQKGDSDVTTH